VSRDAPKRRNTWLSAAVLSHGGLSTVMKLAKLFAENVSAASACGRLVLIVRLSSGRCCYSPRGPAARRKEGASLSCTR
jgi:hypothetical protein